MIRVRIRAAAREDIRDARDWYEDQAAGLGAQFGAALDHAIGRIAENPMMFAVVQTRVRRALMRRFRMRSTSSWMMIGSP